MGLVARTTHTVRNWAAVMLMAAALFGCVRAELPAPAMQTPGAAGVAPGELFGADARPLEFAELARRATVADYVLVGESHSSACDHRVQADVLAAMTEALGRAPVLGLEMVPAERQPVLDRFNAGEIGPDDLEKAVDWETVWGHPYSVYKPLFEAARRLGAPLAALNVPKRVMEAVSAGGLSAIAPEDRELAPPLLVPAAPAQVEALGEELARHARMMPEAATRERAERFMRVQALWDTAMAREAARARRAFGRPVLIVAGSGHVEQGWGIARRLAALDRRSRSLTVMPWRGDALVDPAEADAFFYCGLSHTSRLGFALEERGGEVVVTGVAPDTKAARAGFAEGDVLLTVLDMPVENLWSLHKAALVAGREKRPLTFTVRRGGEVVELAILLTGTPGADEADGAEGSEGEAKADPKAAPEAAPQPAPKPSPDKAE